MCILLLTYCYNFYYYCYYKCPPDVGDNKNSDNNNKIITNNLIS